MTGGTPSGTAAGRRRDVAAGEDTGLTAADLWLRAVVRSEPGLTVLTGGQTGVDTLAARAALGAGLPVHLVFPLGFRQEDGALTAARRRALGGAVFHQLGSDSFRYRTETVVHLSDAVLLLDPARGDGCALTALLARRSGRPLLSLARDPAIRAGIAAWLAKTGCRVLAVAGCRASLLTAHRAEPMIQSQLEAVIAAAVEHHAHLLAHPADVP